MILGKLTDQEEFLKPLLTVNLKSNFISAIGYFYVFTADREFYFHFIAK